MKYMNVARKFGRQVGAAAVITATTTGVAMADSAALATKLSAGESDINVIGWAAMGLVVAAALFKYLRRAA